MAAMAGVRPFHRPRITQDNLMQMRRPGTLLIPPSRLQLSDSISCTRIQEWLSREENRQHPWETTLIKLTTTLVPVDKDSTSEEKLHQRSGKLINR